MRLRLRLILSFLIMAIISVAFLIFQANLLFIRQLKTMEDNAAQILEMINSGKVDVSEVAQLVLNNQTNYEQALVSFRFGLFVIISILLVVMVGLGIWLAVKFSAPFERIAASANHLLGLVQSTATQKNILEPENEEKIEDANQYPPQTLKKEEKLIAYTLDIVTSFVQDELTRLKKDLKRQSDGKNLLSNQLIGLEQFVHETTEAFDVSLSLDKMTRRISQQFRSSFVGIFIMDDSRQFIELKAAYNNDKDAWERDGRIEGGQQNFEVNTRFRVNETEKSGEGIVGRAAVTGEVCQSDNLLQFAQVLPNSEISPVSLEVAFPIRAHGVVTGVLDIISKTREPFSSEEMAILHVFADQLALVNEYDKLVEAETLGVERSTYGDITRQAWDVLTRDRSEWGYRSDENGIYKAEGEWLPWMIQAVQQGKVVVWQDKDYSIASVPIQVRDYTLGVLDFRKASESTWTGEELILVQTLTDQLGQALESARLYQNTQMRAERERVLTDITSKVRASTNVDVILQTAIRELAEALRVPKGSIQLRSYGGEIKERRFSPTSRGQDNA
jgi:GAF domain-containing protein